MHGTALEQWANPNPNKFLKPHKSNRVSIGAASDYLMIITASMFLKWRDKIFNKKNRKLYGLVNLTLIVLIDGHER